MNPWAGLRGLPPSVWLLAAATLVNRAGTMFLPFLALYLTRDRGLREDQAGLVMSLYGAAALASAPFAGRLVDRFGAVPLLRLSLFSSGALLLAFPLAARLGGTPAVCVTVFAIAATSEPARPASFALVPSLVEGDRLRASFALLRLAANLGMSVGPAVGGFLAARSFTALFVTDAITTLAAGFVLLALAAPPQPAGAAAAGSAAADRAAFLAPLHDRRLRGALGFGLVIGAVFFQFESTLPIFLVEHLGLSMEANGFVFTVNTVLIVLFEVAINLATARWSYGRTLAAGALLVGVGFGGFALARGLVSAYACVVVWTFGEMFFFPGLNAYVAALAPPARRGMYMALYGMAFSLALTLAPPAGTFVLRHFGPTPVWLGCLVIGLAAAAVALRMPEAPADDASK